MQTQMIGATLNDLSITESRWPSDLFVEDEHAFIKLQRSPEQPKLHNDFSEGALDTNPAIRMPEVVCIFR